MKSIRALTKKCLSVVAQHTSNVNCVTVSDTHVSVPTRKTKLSTKSTRTSCTDQDQLYWITECIFYSLFFANTENFIKILKVIDITLKWVMSSWRHWLLPTFISWWMENLSYSTANLCRKSIKYVKQEVLVLLYLVGFLCKTTEQQRYREALHHK